jgi:hypothetical protein
VADSPDLDPLLHQHFQRSRARTPQAETLLHAIIERLPARPPAAHHQFTVAHVLVLATFGSFLFALGAISRSVLDLHQLTLAAGVLITLGLVLIVAARWVRQGEAFLFNRLMRRTVWAPSGDVLVYRLTGAIAVVVGWFLLS